MEPAISFDFLLPSPPDEEARGLELLYGAPLLDQTSIRALARRFDETAGREIAARSARVRGIVCEASSHDRTADALLRQLKEQHTMYALLIEKREKQLERVLISENGRGGLSSLNLDRSMGKRRVYVALVRDRERSVERIYTDAIRSAARGNCGPGGRPELTDLYFEPAAIALIRFAESLPPVPRAVVFASLTR
ncbi:MAG: hypothetical protein HY042_13400 [Spirochaetia bacterium]|nr:hypothetical protein [Spirochaetia bacterium]